MFRIQNFRMGFTLFEMLLVVTVLSLLLGIGIPIYLTFQSRNEVAIAAHTAVESLRRASLLAEGMEGDSSWGSLATTSRIIVFKGSGFSTRDPSFDEFFDISPSVSISGTAEFVFEKFTGMPLTAGITTFTSVNGETREVNVNTKGTISY